MLVLGEKPLQHSCERDRIVVKEARFNPVGEILLVIPLLVTLICKENDSKIIDVSYYSTN